MGFLVYIVVWIGLSALLALGFEFHRRQLKSLRFRDRENIEVEKLIRSSFGDRPEDFPQLVHWWNVVAKTLRLDARKLRPHDRFDSELKPVQGFITEDELIQLDELIDDLGLSDDCFSERTETLGQLVCFLSRRAKK